ncbi:SAM-dependent methyltransferase [Paenibacillus auburnensis]|uniref:SAM-dependent methyltransferase n=1 Tax=Paenibacillus auburnensis TaxID=2905649 RepID=UPI001F27FE9F|nr:SAM-dependent methyltransferase [Paenibacillus auburnensis]
MSGAKLDLERIVFIGRTFDEYMRMFDLQPGELRGRSILDCPAGACSFTAEANRHGAMAVAADIAYSYSAEALQVKGLSDIEHTLIQLDKARDNFKWDVFQSIEGLRQARTEALTVSTLDRLAHQERYVAAELPVLPFADQAFDITLSAHFLFMYGDRLDVDFHLETLRELLRVTKAEIRIFPLVDLSCRRYAHLDGLIRFIQTQGWSAEEVQVSYEFQKGADSMLLLKRG